MDKQRILIADDNEINRMIISGMLENRYELLQAKDGAEAIAMIQGFHGDIDLILLDLIMPEMDGIEVLQKMNEQGWIRDIPVIMISAETSTSTIMKAYELGAEDYIERPFVAETVSKRIHKAILLHAEKKNLTDALTEEFGKRERQNDIMINILSHIVEFRNGESGMHVLHINVITELLLNAILSRTTEYKIGREDIPLIRLASSLHDIGKMMIPEAILNKPGKLTAEEFEVMKTHSMAGYDMISKVEMYQDEPLIQYIKNICRYHHERWDGRGYPDHLTGDEIPLEAQVVSLADVYDALTSERCYKKAFSHEKAMEMILGGECGTFNPTLLECLQEIEKVLKAGLSENAGEYRSHIAEALLQEWTLDFSNTAKGANVSRNIRLLRSEEQRHETFRRFSDEAWFEYYTDPEMIEFNPGAAQMLDLPPRIIDPFRNEEFIRKCGNSIRTEINTGNEEQRDGMEIFDKVVTLEDGNRYALRGRLFFSLSEKNGTEYVSGAMGRIIPVIETGKGNKK